MVSSNFDSTELRFTVFQYSSTLNQSSMNALNSLVREDVVAMLGPIQRIEIDYKKEKKVFKSKTPLFSNDIDDFMQSVYFNNDSFVFYSRDVESDIIILSLNIKNNINREVCLNISRKITSILNFSTFSIDNLTEPSEYWETLEEIDPNVYTPYNYAFAADTMWANIYPPKSIRDKFYLPLPDDFYLHIPADYIERLENGSIMVNLYFDFKANIETVVHKRRLVIDYYKNELERLGIWGRIRWSPKRRWRKEYKQVLQGLGFDV